MTPDHLNPQLPLQNRLLAALGPDVQRFLAPRLEPVTLELRQVLLAQDAPITHVYFPTAGVCSLVKETPGGVPIEVATVGKEGFVGVPVVLGVDASTELVICQIPGAALRLDVGGFREALQAFPELGRRTLRFTQAMIAMIAQASACNRLHNVEERAARWLLMTHDHVEGEPFSLTQEFLAQMLGVRRQAVNVAAGMLARAGLISYLRGEVRVLDREGLEAAACECYQAIRRNHARLLGYAGGSNSEQAVSMTLTAASKNGA